MTRRRLLLIAVVGIATTFFFAAASAQSPPPVESKSTPNAIEGPLSISASEFGYFSRGGSWTLVANDAGKATLTIYTSHESTREFQISKKQLDDLRKVLTQERFFELQGEYGELVSDGSTNTITIRAANRKKTVELKYLMNWVHNDVAKLEEPARAIRVMHVIRGWFDDPEAVDLRKYDRIVLEAVARRK
jgi:hypothetical protein